MKEESRMNQNEIRKLDTLPTYEAKPGKQISVSLKTKVVASFWGKVLKLIHVARVRDADDNLHDR